MDNNDLFKKVYLPQLADNGQGGDDLVESPYKISLVSAMGVSRASHLAKIERVCHGLHHPGQDKETLGI